MNNESTKPKLWSLPYCLILVSTFTANITMTMMMPVLPIYIKEMGQDPAMSGIAVGVYTFAALLCRPLFGWLLDHYAKKLVLMIGAVVIMLAILSYSIAGYIAVLLILRVIHGIGYSATTNSTSTFTADLVPPVRRSEGIGYFGAVFAVALALGPALSMAIFNAFGMTSVFISAFIIGVIGCVAVAIIPKSEQESKPPQEIKEQDKVTAKPSIIEKTALPACSVMFAVSFAYIAVMSFLPSYTLSLGLGGMSAFFICYAAALVVSRIFVGKFTDKHGLHHVLLPGVALMTVTFALLCLGTSPITFILAAVFFGIGYGAVQPTLNAIVIANCDARRRGAANATFFASMDLGLGLGAVIWGFVIGGFGYPVMYGCCIGSMVLACVCYFVFLRRKRGEKNGDV